jgi:hypothetical protein
MLARKAVEAGTAEAECAAKVREWARVQVWARGAK